MREERLVEEVAVVVPGSGGGDAGKKEEKQRTEVAHSGSQHHHCLQLKTTLKTPSQFTHTLSLTNKRVSDTEKNMKEQNLVYCSNGDVSIL